MESIGNVRPQHRLHKALRKHHPTQQPPHIKLHPSIGYAPEPCFVLPARCITDPPQECGDWRPMSEVLDELKLFYEFDTFEHGNPLLEEPDTFGMTCLVIYDDSRKPRIVNFEVARGTFFFSFGELSTKFLTFFFNITSRRPKVV